MLIQTESFLPFRVHLAVVQEKKIKKKLNKHSVYTYNSRLYYSLLNAMNGSVFLLITHTFGRS